MSVEIAPFRPDQARAVAELVLAIQRDEFHVPVTLEGQPDLLDISKYFQDGGGEFWVAAEGARVVGTIGLKALRSASTGALFFALKKMFVAADRRGRGGVGQRLIDVAVEHARGKGARQIYLGSTAQMKAAHRFYEKNGFVAVSPEQLPPEFPRVAVDTVFYLRTLD